MCIRDRPWCAATPSLFTLPSSLDLQSNDDCSSITPAQFRDSFRVLARSRWRVLAPILTCQLLAAGAFAAGFFPPDGGDAAVCPRPILGVYDDHDFGWNNGNGKQLANRAALKQVRRSSRRLEKGVLFEGGTFCAFVVIACQFSNFLCASVSAAVGQRDASGCCPWWPLSLIHISEPTRPY